MSVLNKLTEGIVNRDLRSEGAALLTKWEKTGLLEGLETDQSRQGMARLLENQAKQLLKETSVMAASGGGDVQGFSAVAFPLVRRVFAGLFANDIVSVQPMSLPSGLIFFLDFTFSDATTPRLSYTADTSLYGGGVVGSQITGGLDLDGLTGAETGPYALNNGYASPTGSAIVTHTTGLTVTDTGIFGSSQALDKLCLFDPDFTSGTTDVVVADVTVASATGGGMDNVDYDNLISIAVQSVSGDAISGSLVRRLTQVSGTTRDAEGDPTKLRVVFASDTQTAATLSSSVVSAANITLTFAERDTFAGGTAIGSVDATDFGLENQANIPEIDIKVDSVAVTARTKKLKAKWTPELGQDLNAYHNLDAEVELTSILSEQIALEIDHEILQDLINGASAATYYWSRSPGLFVNRETGIEIGASSAAPDFTGTVSEWYETLAETINDVSAQIHRKTLRGGANFIVCSPEVANILEFTAGFRASVTADVERGTIGAVKVGSLTKKFDVYVDPYFPRNVILVGRNGGSFLESGYVYAPYVPLQVTPTIFGVEDFVPRKGVMTRYAKKMVRPDMYGLVICRGLLGEPGATS
jgi:hypothetical protein